MKLSVKKQAFLPQECSPKGMCCLKARRPLDSKVVLASMGGDEEQWRQPQPEKKTTQATGEDFEMLEATQTCVEQTHV